MNEPVLARLQQLMTLREEVETLGPGGPWIPTADWTDEDTHLALHLDVPGVGADSLELLEEGHSVTVAGERSALNRLLGGDRPAGTFRRTLTFPQEVIPQTGTAQLANGVLTVRFQKRHPTIDVHAEDLDSEG
ncbi:Hsp20/alpha crystallin family protein [Deinococcus sp. KSM4-11]|uniref:Hsp20/alpha crystallin family protein n=1 Tax=Deinococcus sp. KSM4-11 TaxID=2568654 RepID=UPI0010A507E3|nr:Hsp20/alpha crystallin family protein [Deinococcus sp. KSM4-11]THF88371.1 Hsp20/alpha crystallin family protein [Deinococcus sp. KSM4-11]